MARGTIELCRIIFLNSISFCYCQNWRVVKLKSARHNYYFLLIIWVLLCQESVSLSMCFDHSEMKLVTSFQLTDSLHRIGENTLWLCISGACYLSSLEALTSVWSGACCSLSSLSQHWRGHWPAQATPRGRASWPPPSPPPRPRPGSSSAPGPASQRSTSLETKCKYVMSRNK